MPKTELRYTAVIAPMEAGGYAVRFPAIPDLATQAATSDEARAAALDCLRSHLECLRDDGLPLPPCEDVAREQVTIALEQLTVALDTG